MARILVVDDNQEMAKALVRVLGGMFHQAEHCASPEVLSKAGQSDFDLAITDTGGQTKLLKGLRDKGISLPVVLAVGEARTAPDDPDGELGRFTIITKPMTNSKLAVAINQALAEAVSA